MRKRLKKIIKITRPISNFLSKGIIKWGVIPALLIFLWISLSLFFSSYRSFTVLQYAHNQDNDNEFYGRKLLKGQKLKGTFKARANYLGIIAVRFGDNPGQDFEKEDVILFRIKRKGSDAWIYQNKYRSGSFTSNQYFPFGFKEIEKSKGETYEFEIFSLNGNKESSLETKHTNPVYLSKYKFPKKEIFKDDVSIIKFISQKIITFITNYDSLLSSAVFLLPFIFYIISIFSVSLPLRKIIKSKNILSLPLRKIIKSKNILSAKKLFAILVVILIFFDVIFYEFTTTGFTLGLLGLWIYTTYLNKFKSNVTLFFAFILIIISILSIYFELKISVDKISSFAYFLILIVFFQKIFEHKKSRFKNL